MHPAIHQVALAIALLPERTDIFALPTSAGLTAWDAAFIMLPVGLALAVISAGALPTNIGGRIWKLRHILAFEGIVYLLFNDVVLSVLLASLVVLSMIIMIKCLPDGGLVHASPGPVPSPTSALGGRIGELFYGLILGSALAACIKVLLPTLTIPTPAIAVLSIVIGLVLPLNPAMSAIPALALIGFGGGLLAGGLWLTMTMLRQLGEDTGRDWLSSIVRYLHSSRTGQ